MDREKLRVSLWRSNSNLRGKLGGSKVAGLEDFYRLGARLYSIGNFTIEHFDVIGDKDIESVVELYSELDRVHIMKGAKPDIEANSMNAEDVTLSLENMEEVLIRTYNYGGLVDKSQIDALNFEIQSIKSGLEESSTQYVMNIGRIRTFGLDSEVTSAYDNCVTYIQESISSIENSIKTGENIVGCSEVLTVDKRLTDLLTLLLETESMEKLAERLSSFERVLSILSQKQEVTKQQATVK